MLKISAYDNPLKSLSYSCGGIGVIHNAHYLDPVKD